MIRFLVAMEREAEALGILCEIIGIGGKNIPATSEEDILVNVGYCGGYMVPVGTVVEPRFVVNTETHEIGDLEQNFPCESQPCFTSPGFVMEPVYDCPTIYDMELWHISRLPHKKLYCLKIVSDNLDETECEAFDDRSSWERVRKLLKGANLI